MAPSGRADRRADSLDALRGCAALMVLACHVILFAPALPPAATWALRFTPLFVLYSGRAPVVFFFVLSGYVLTLSLLRPGAPGPLGFALRRACRLLPPVAGAVLLSAALRRLAFAGPPPGYDPYLEAVMWQPAPAAWDLLRQSLLLGADEQFGLDPALWSLVHEWRVSLALPAALLFRRRPWLLLALGLVLQGLATAGGARQDLVLLGRHLGSTLAATLYFAAPFAAGAALALGGGGLRLEGEARAAAWVALLGCAWLHSDLGYVIGSLLLIVMARGDGGLARSLARPAPRFLGRVSYSLYLVHMPVLACAAHLGAGRVPPWAALGLGGLASFAVAALFHAAVEVPAQRLSRRIGRRGERREAVRLRLAGAGSGPRWEGSGDRHSPERARNTRAA
jgi:peptidoglycan/LPS O-acetylase OafA/YrhL